MAHYKFNVYSLTLLFALCCPAPSTAHTDAEVRIAGFYARVYRFYAEALEGAERREDARHAREWGRRLRRAARGGAQS